MSNLFSTFDPLSWFWLPLNWTSSLTALVMLPTLFWMSPSHSHIILKSLTWKIMSEFKTILNPTSAPGFLLIPLTFFIFIGLNNTLGLLPYVFTASSHLSFTVAVALPLWLGHMVMAWLHTPQLTLAHLVPLGTPPALMPFMVFIELISNIIRPLTLSVRLAANMVAGHLLLSLLAGQAPNLSWSIFLFLMSALILLATLECAVSLIQAYVFSILSTLYVNEVNSSSIS